MNNISILKDLIRPKSLLYNKILDNYKELGNNTIHPLDSSNIEIKNKFTIEKRCETSSMYLKKHKPEEFDALSDMRQVLSNDGMNPHKFYFPKQFFIDDIGNKETKQEIIERFKNLKKKDWPIIQYGKRGVGKTLLQNILIHEYNIEFEKEKIFWIRCDAHKLYKLWSNTHTRRTTIDIYLQCQLLYVFCKYYNEIEIFNNGKREKVISPMFNEIYSLLENSEYNKDKKRLIRYLEGGRYVYYEPSKSISIIRNEILTDEGIAKGGPRSYLLDHILTQFQNNITSKDESMSRWLKLSDYMKEFLNLNNYHILFIIDGIDNINFSGEPDLLENYYEIVRNISNLLYQRPQTKNCSTYFCMREDTYKDIKAHMACNTDTSDRYYNEEDFFLISQEKPDKIDEILDARVKVCMDKWEKLHSTTLTSTIFSNLPKLIINDSFKEYFAEMNIRDFLLNQLGMVRLLVLRQIQKGANSDNIEKLYNNYFLKNLFLNGKLYLDSSKKSNIASNEGRYFYNIFYSEVGSPLLSLRILQILSLKMVSRKTLICYLRTYFDYESGSLLNAIRILKSFDIIETELNNVKLLENNERIAVNEKPKFEIGELFDLHITTKGKQLIKLIFSNLEILYLLALDTKIPVYFISKYVDSFNIQVGSRTFYVPNCIKSSISFLNYLRFIDEMELDIVKKRMANEKLFELAQPDSKDFINGIKRDVDIVFSIENFIKSELLINQMELLYNRISIEPEKAKVIEFVELCN